MVTSSVIIPTYNGAEKISNLLQSLLNQTVKDFELIIVVDGSTDNTLRVIKDFEMLFQSIRVIEQKNCGRAAVRNRGALEATTSLLIFYDDDMVPAIDSVQKHREFHSVNEGLLSGDPCEPYENTDLDIRNYKVWLTSKWTGVYRDGLNKIDYKNLFFSASNCSMRKFVFDKLHGFDQRLTDAEDYDLAYRALENDISVYYDKSNKAIHNDRITAISYIKRLREYSNAQKKLKQLHPQRYYATNTKITVGKKIGYRVFAFPLWAKMIDKNSFFLLIPKRLRYRLYDIIIQSLAVEYPHVKL